MSIWKSIFLHEFLDGDLTNLHAVPGELGVLPGGSVPAPTPAPEERGFLVSPGRALRYRFAEQLADVIGVDLGVEVLLPPQTVAEFPLVSLGGGRVTLSMNQLRFAFIGPELRGLADIVLAVDGQRMEVEHSFPADKPLRLHVRWHTHGQAHIWDADRLRAYEPGFAAGRSFALDRLVVGGPEGVIVDPGAVFRARRVYLKVLREDDARNEIDKHIPIDERYLQPSRCAQQVRELHGELVGRSRVFMVDMINNLTQAWRNGEPGGPFSAEANAAHAAAVAAAEAFGQFLDGGAGASADTFLEQIGKFLDVLAAADPDGYAALVADLDTRSQSLDPYCRQQLQPLYEANADTLGPVAELLRKTWQRAASAQGGQDHA